MTLKKRKSLATLITVGVHLVVLVLLSVLSLQASTLKSADADGIPVLLGEIPDAAGVDLGGLPSPPEEVSKLESAPQESTPERTAAPAPKERKSEASAKQIVQEEERSVAAEEEDAKKKKAKEAEVRRQAEEARKREAAEEAKKAAAIRKAAEETAARKRAEEKARTDAAAAAANSKMAGAFGNGGKAGSSGYTQGQGSEGVATGNANVGVSTGVGGDGTGIAAKVGNRTMIAGPRPIYTPDNRSEGTIVVSIVVNAAGKVVSAHATGGKVTNPAYRRAAEQAALKSTFSTSSNQSEQGTITYNIKLR